MSRRFRGFIRLFFAMSREILFPSNVNWYASERWMERVTSAVVSLRNQIVIFFPRHFLEIEVFSIRSKGKRIFRQSCFVFMIHAKCHFDAWWIFPPQSARMILIECTYVRGYTRLKRLITDDLASRIYLRFGVDDTNRRITVVEFLLKFFLRYLSPYELKTLSNFSTNYKLSKLKLFLSLRFRIVKKFYCTTKMFLYFLLRIRDVRPKKLPFRKL